MRLLTDDLLARFREIGAQDGKRDPIVICKIIERFTGDTLYVFEYKEREGDLLALLERGPHTRNHPELFGGFKLSALEIDREATTGEFYVCRDESFKECRFSQAVKERRALIYRRLE